MSYSNLSNHIMESLEIQRTRPEIGHDCNECEVCKRSMQEVWRGNECAICKFIFFEKLYKDFSSYNKIVDEIIKIPIYYPPNDEYSRINNGSLNYYEWIPWERLSNIGKIGEGGFGTIYKATYIDGFIDQSNIKHHGSMEYKREKNEYRGELINTVAIKFIKTSLRNSDEVFEEGLTQITETSEYGIIMEFAQYGDMRKFLSKNFHSMSWSERLKITWSIASGLGYIHSAGMVHRDLHSGNILRYKYGFFGTRICDLGLCQPTKNEATTTEEKKIYGVIPYIPPEVLRGENFTMAGDIYSLGMLLWELATGKPPFYDRSHDQILIMNILNGARPEITSSLIPSYYAKLIEKCWDDNPMNRPTAEEVRKKLGELNRISLKDILIKISGWRTKLSKTIQSLKKTIKRDDTKSSTTNGSRVIIHPGAVYTSRLLTAQMVEFSKG
ncbi:hypothetical protein G9A89_023469 [Geosiphon pyriformis]|nr:hypothetical protein G9A89_023469 [Geosiphon pyriformis]